MHNLATARSHSGCHHHLHHSYLSNKIQNGNFLVQANPGLPGKMAVTMEREIISLTVYQQHSFIDLMIFLTQCYFSVTVMPQFF